MTGRVAPRQAQRGVASLIVLMLLLGASVLMAAWSQRHAWVDLRTTTAQWRRALAFEAAESGLAWAQAMLNQGQAIDSACRTAAAGASQSFAARYLAPPDRAGMLQPRTRPPASGAAPLQMLCAHESGRLSCHCPADAAAALTVSGGGAVPAFLLSLGPSPRTGSVELVSIGCNHLAPPCLSGSGEAADAVVRLRVTLTRLPALATPPGAVMTVRGDIDAGAAALGLHNADARSGGLAAQAGGRILGNALRLHTAPGASPAAALLGGDEALAASSAAQFFVRHFGIERGQWALQPGVSLLDCTSGDCGPALGAAAEAAVETARLAVRGDLRLDGPLQLGRPGRPIVLQVDGLLHLRGPVELHGLVHATRMRWDAVGPGGGGLLRGAVLLDEGYAGDGAPDLVYDAEVIRRLQRESGTWVRVPGSWRDF